MKRPLITVACVLALTIPAVGFAGNSGDGSEYGTQPGFVVANGNNFAGGANGYETGINNSTLCGNRQGNLP
jgi:hypothetical protein